MSTQLKRLGNRFFHSNRSQNESHLYRRIKTEDSSNNDIDVSLSAGNIHHVPSVVTAPLVSRRNAPESIAILPLSINGADDKEFEEIDIESDMSQSKSYIQKPQALTIRSMFEGYTQYLDKYPLITKAITAGIIGALGDTLAQWFEIVYASNANMSFYYAVNLRRSVATLMEGVFVSGPLMHCAYNFYESILPVAETGGITGSIMAATQVLMDCFFMDPIYVTTAIIFVGLLEGQSLSLDIIPQLRGEFFSIVKGTWASSLILSPIQFMAFRLLPLQFRVLAVNLEGILWNAILFYLTHKSRRHGM